MSCAAACFAHARARSATSPPVLENRGGPPRPGPPARASARRGARGPGHGRAGLAAGRAPGADHAPRPRRLDVAFLRERGAHRALGPGTERRPLQGGAGRRGRQRVLVRRPPGRPGRHHVSPCWPPRTTRRRGRSRRASPPAFASTTSSQRPRICPRTSRPPSSRRATAARGDCCSASTPRRWSGACGVAPAIGAWRPCRGPGASMSQHILRG
jgi:hypothetical protein